MKRQVKAVLAVLAISYLALSAPAQWIGMDSALQYGYSLSDFLGADTFPARNPNWFAPNGATHDMYLYDQGSTDMLEEENVTWTKAAINRFNSNYALNLVHQVIVDNDIYEADSAYISDLPNITHNEDESEEEELWQGYEEKEIGTTTPEWIVAGRKYYIKTFWITIGGGGSGWFKADSELTNCVNLPYPNCWNPAGHQELGEMYFQSTNNDRWSFNSVGYRHGWNATNASATSVSGGKFYINPSGNDPYITSPDLKLSAADYKRITIRMASNLLDGNGNVYFKTSASNSYSESKMVSFSVANCAPASCGGNAQFRNYTIYLGSNSRWTGTIRGIRIDPGNKGQSGTSIDTVGFDTIQITR